MKKNKSAFSLVVVIWLVLIMSLLVLYILEYMIPYSKNVKWIENSSNAFYQAENSVEDAMLFFSTRWTGSIAEFADKSQLFQNNTIAYKYNTTSSWNVIPYSWEWNSEFDTTFNTISQWNPIQLDIWNGIEIDWNHADTEILFKVPDLDKNPSTIETLSWANLAIINWQLTTDNDTLNATGSWIKADDIDWSDFDISSEMWIKLNNAEESFGDFYNTNCGSWSWCSLKFSIINKLELDNTEKTSVPYLEYKFNFETWVWKKVPLRYSRIKSSGKSYGFQKHLEVKIPQQTTNEAFDFTVFQ